MVLVLQENLKSDSLKSVSEKTVKHSNDLTSSSATPKISAFDPDGPNSSLYNGGNTNSADSFDADMLKSYSKQISEISNKVFKLYKKKMRIKERMSQLKHELRNGSINEEEFKLHSTKILKSHDEYKVYEIYDEYIAYLISHMKSYSEGIFSYIDSHKYDIPIISRTEEEKRLETDYLKAIKESEGAESSSDDGWKSEADEFAEKRKKKESLMDKVANSIVKIFVPNRDKSKILAMQREQEGSSSKISMFLDWFLGKDSKNSLLDKKKQKKQSALDKFIEERRNLENVVGGKTAFSQRFKNVRKMHFEADDEFKERDEKAARNDVKEFVKRLGQKKTSEISYKPTTYSSLANVLMKDYSVEIVNSFPGFFKVLYKNIRYANMHVLSSTYTNTMLFTSILIGSVSLIFVGLVSLIMALPIPMVLANAFLAGIFGIGMTVAVFVSNPKYIMKNRERNINTNLPFAIDHMAAVASSGVSPANMFQLISQSKDYGEVSVEIEKIVEYIDLFGYDIMSAMRKVSLTCPSVQMREFFEGFISNAESGGELKDFLREFADQSMLSYRLERQKYTESISTFSDIYTGLMVASPLFFVATLSMVSILGGTVGGMDVNTMMILGTYVFIPLLNVVFILFMEITQPSI